MTESPLAWLRAGADCHTGLTHRTTAMTALDTAVDTGHYAGVNGATTYYDDRGAGPPSCSSTAGSRPAPGGRR